MTAALAKKTSLLRDSFLASSLAAKGRGTIFFWNALPIFLLLMNMGVSFANPCFFTKYFPFLAMGSVGAIVRFRIVGWMGSTLALAFALLFCFTEIPAAERLWQIGLFTAFALTFFILHASLTEAGACWDKLQGEVEETKTLYHQSALDSQRLLQIAADREEELKEEIERFKDEAELRRIEKVNTLESYALIESEIELLTSQKDTFVTEARNARVKTIEMELKFQELDTQLQAAKAALYLLETRPPVVQTAIVADPEVLKRAEELAIELSLAQEALQQLENRPPVVQTVVLPDPAMVRKAEELEKELVSTKEALRALAQCQPLVQAVTTQDSVTDELMVEMRKELATAEGRLKQLRAQFEERTHILAQTRQELFRVKEALLAQERERTLFEVDKENELSMPLENEMVSLALELEKSEQETKHLEELISRILSQ